MSKSQYHDLEKLFEEYEEIVKTINADRLIMKNYPKLLIMSAASLFEVQIKNRCKSFRLNPNKPLASDYPNLQRLISSKPNKSPEDKVFSKLEAFTDSNSGKSHLSALKFYNLYGGKSFEQSVEMNFALERNEQLQSIHERINNLEPLKNIDERYVIDHIKQCELRDELNKCSFKDSEIAYLTLKHKRNIIAHHYTDGTTDTVEDVRKFYCKAVIYVCALEKSITNLTIQIPSH